ncbi:2-succinyl-5-enolpyruvyl-6-hydroxy-3-cyclohexene-1-carboxylic-acid synthase [Halovenus salina]|uniref:2-succinyl-5-enolpyruvyl-6-hydroxy-3- cyclohexene-1-carboxylic-acid synthase n=1 Tax=Halovenus salina TaxID=1510225 RepID=UPI002260AC53|nr:2-succinyl-5-enolpyruvyl-6-hydroxy-3-cyclohexene-1-carboxylic-acid synthase [Halovenus salina]
MTAPNRNTLWAEVLVDELVAAGVDAVCLSPGSRSTPLTVAFAEHPDVETFSHLDERASAFFALGRARRTGTPTPVVCTSGTAAANFHPAILEARESRVPFMALTADRPPELRDSGANQTTDQVKLYGDAVRWYRELPEPEADDRKLRSLRVTVDRAVATATDTPAGPVHLNVPFRKPLEPTSVEGDVPDDLAERSPLAVDGRDGPFVEMTAGTKRTDAATVGRLADALTAADRGLLVCGPADAPAPDRDALGELAAATGFPVLADPLSGHRFGSQDGALVCGGYDSYLDDPAWPDPEIVVRFGASPTSKTLRKYLAGTDSRQIIVDPAGGWREAEFTATDLVSADSTWLASALADAVEDLSTGYRDRFESAEQTHWEIVEDARDDQLFEGGVVGTVADRCPAGSTLFVSNSMPVRDLDRFGRPRSAPVTVLGNRGVSGIDGIVSTGLGAGSATDEPLVLVTGDLAYYHDMNGLLALSRCGVDATIVLIDNDGGGIFHKLPIEDFDPPFTEQFRTPHGLDFSPTADLYDLEFRRIHDQGALTEAFADSLDSEGTQVLSVELDGQESHRFRERLHDRVQAAIHGN